MKKLLLLCLLPVMLQGQARLNKSEEEIIEAFPEIKFKKGLTSDNLKYIMGDFPRGTFVYYFDEYNYTNLNIMVPYSIEKANEQVEIYNGKYVIISKTSWNAYMDNGMIMKIDMIFDDEINKFIFRYSL